MHIHAEVGSLLRTVAQTHCRYHVALGCDAYTRAASLRTLALYLLPEVILGVLDVVALRVVLYLRHDKVNLLQLQVDDVVHDALRLSYVLLEQLEVELRLLRERIFHVRVEIHREQTARVVRTERNLAARIRRYGLETEVGIAVGDALAYDGVPEQHARLGALPCVVHNLAPQLLSRNLLLHERVAAVDGELLCVWLVGYGSLHELVVNLHAHVGARHLSFCHLRVDERLAVRVLDAYREHERAASAVLRHLAGRVAVALHERHQTRRRESRVVHRRSLRANLREVVTHAAATLHQLHLLLVETHDGAVRIAVAVDANHEAVAERRHLVVVADARHRTACRNDIAEVVEQLENLLCRHRVLVFLLNASYLVSQTMVHILWRTLVDIAVAVLHRVLVHPYASSQFVAGEVVQRSLVSLVESVCFQVFHYLNVSVILLSFSFCVQR